MSGRTEGPTDPLISTDTLIRAGGTIFVLGFLAVVAVPLASGGAAEVLLLAATVLVPVGFLTAATGLGLQIRARVRSSRPSE